jgi:apolipoprotein N-acyltransferase
MTAELGRWAAFVIDARGWRRFALGLAFGALAALAMPPTFALPLLFVALPGLVWLTDGARDWKGSFLGGWYFGIGFFAAGLYWISYALLVDPERYGWLVPFAVGGLGAGLGIFSGLATLIVWLTRVGGVGRVLMLAAVWTALEWVRGWILTGFPWNPIGHAWAFDAGPIQLAALVGVYGLSLMTVAMAAMPAVMRTKPVIVALVVPALVWLGGQARLTIEGPAPQTDVHLAVVQPNIPQTLKWDERLAGQHVAKLLSLSRARPKPVRTNTEEDDTRPEPPRRVTHVIWPESAIPSAIDFNARHSVLAEVVPPGGALITGATRIEGRGLDLKAWNSLAVMDGEGRIVTTYDKHHLVPFGEYMPLRGFLPFDKLAVGAVDFTAGPGPRTIPIPAAPPVSPLICYEAIFPGEVVDASHRPQWLLNVTNDAWFGISSGPHQHFASARLRAVEEGLPLVRAANTGISAVIDPYGRVLARLGLDEAGTIDAALPAALTKTLFANGGNLIPLGLAGLIAAAGFLARSRPLGTARSL